MQEFASAITVTADRNIESRIERQVDNSSACPPSLKWDAFGTTAEFRRADFVVIGNEIGPTRRRLGLPLLPCVDLGGRWQNGKNQVAVANRVPPTRAM